MREGSYRDARVGFLQRIAAADAAAKALRERMTGALLRLVPEELEKRIAELEAVTFAEDAPVAELGQIADQRDALVGALDEALALAPELTSRLTKTKKGAPAPPPQSDPWGPIGVEEGMAPIRAEVEELVKGVDEDAEVTARGTRLTVSMKVDRVPLLWIVELDTQRPSFERSNLTTTGFSGFFGARHVVEAYVPKRLPRLFVRPQTIGDSIRAFFTRARDLEQGIPAFDDAFHVEGDETFAKPLLSKEVRSRLVDCAEQGELTLELGGGIVKVKWSRTLPPLVDVEVFALAARLVSEVRREAKGFTLATK